MLELIIWLGTLLCTNPNYISGNHSSSNEVQTATASTTFDTGGETGGNPKPPPPPPGK